MKRISKSKRTNLKSALAGAVVICSTVTLSACGMDNDKAPVVSGNTVDRWNQLDKILPEAPLVNVSYRYELAAESNLTSNRLGTGQGWIYRGVGEQYENSLVIVSLVNGVEDRDLGVSGSITVGRQQFQTVRYCLNTNPGNLDETAAAYLQAIEAAGYSLGGDKYLQLFAGQAPDSEGRYIDIAYMQTLDGTGQACDADGAFEEDGVVEASPEDLRDRAERSFDVVG